MDPFANYDAWLERPYQDMVEESDRFIVWCELNDVDPDDPNAENLYLESIADEYDDYDYEDDEDGWDEDWDEQLDDEG